MSTSANHSESIKHFFEALLSFETDELEVLLDWYVSYEHDSFKEQIGAIKAIIKVRNTLVGRVLDS